MFSKFDQIELIVEVNVTESGYYHVSLNLHSTDPGSYVYLWGNTDGYWSLGVQNISVFVDATSIYSQGVDSTYTIDSIELRDDNYNYLDEGYKVYTTRFYNHDEFDPPDVLLTNRFWDQGVDIDLDGRFELLEIIVEVDVAKAGNYELELELMSYSNTSGYIGIFGSTSGFWYSGVQNVSIMFDATEFYSILTTIEFEITWLVIWDSNRYMIVQMYDTTFQTQTYDSSEFDTTIDDPITTTTTETSTTTTTASITPGWTISFLILGFYLLIGFKRWKKE